MMDSQELLDVIPHIFLPRRLPDFRQENLIQVEDNLLTLLSSSLSTSNSSYINFPKICPKTCKFLKTWVTQQNLLLSPNFQRHPESIDASDDASKLIADEISGLKQGDVIALYIREQNAGMIISVPTSNNFHPECVVLSTFQASADSGSIMSAPGDLIHTYPESCVKIPKTKILQSQEFVEQLRHLCNNANEQAMPKSRKAGHVFDETRDVPDPVLVTEWAVPAASNSLSDNCTDFPIISKKIRDDVIWKRGRNFPFRRSGLWMTVKVALQISNILELGEEAGTLVYKLMMTHAMHFILIQLNHHDWDLKMQMMAKIARRLEKLKVMLSQMSVNNINHEIATRGINGLVHKVNKDFKIIRGKMDKQWEEINNCDQEIQKLDISQEQIQSDTVHTFKDLRSYINKRQNDVIHTNSLKTIPTPSCPKRLKTNALPQLTFSNSNDYQVDFELWDLEMWVRNHLDEYCTGEHSSFIRVLIKAYSKKAIDHYCEDPVANSRFILTILKCLMVLDKIATNELPMLKEHKSGVDLKIVEILLLPWKSEMQLAHEIETYFQNRDALATYPSLIEERVPTSRAFSVLFARQSVPMGKHRETILNTSAKAIEAKKQEVRRVRDECHELQRQITELTCTYTTYWNGNEEYEKHVSKKCTKCKLEKVRENTLKSVKPYERPLNSDEKYQFAVVFELLIPTTIACLRDILYFVRVELYNSSSFDKSKNQLYCKWTNHSQIMLSTIDQSQLVTLGSTVKSTLVSHYSKSISVEQHEDAFILNNGMNVVFHGDELFPNSRNWKQRCTFQITRCNRATVNGRDRAEVQYEKLQWAINGTSHTPNEVLAKGYECPVKLPLNEFKQFGMLRSGHRLQYRNIIMALTSGTLSIKNESVFQLLSQAQWEAGPSNLQFCRESHSDFEEAKFASETISILESLADSNSKNWSEAYTLITVILTTARITELVADQVVRQNAVKLLRKCRKMAAEWIDLINDLLAKAYRDPEKAKIELKTKLLDAAIALTMTYHVSLEFVPLVMKDSEDVLMWLTASSTLYDEIFWNTAGRIGSLSVVKRSLLRMSVNIGIHLESRIRNTIDDNVFCEFTSRRWKAAASFNGWFRCSDNCEQIYTCTKVLSSFGTYHTVHIDVILGRFLLDGCPVGNISKEIANHEEYKRVFLKADFKVQPNSSGMFTTTSTYHGRTFSFQLINNNLIVHEEGEKKLELIPHVLFQNDVPLHFVDKCSHWWDVSGNRVIFRPKSFDEPDFTQRICYILSLNNMTIQETAVSPVRKLISTNSPSYALLVSTLKLIEPWNYIHIWSSANQDSETMVEVELVRLGLKFKLVGECLESHEFPGMVISKNQNFGTLIGLQNNVLLEEKDVCKGLEPARKVIIPHGEIMIKPNPTLNHHSVEIDLSKLRTPKLFAYEVTDHRFLILKAGRNHSAWFYLAALHAMTASPLPDPFTKVTGTEMAFQILQSARCSSNQPYDAESLKSLNAISTLTPCREYYPQHLKKMHSVTWPSKLAPTAAHEGFTLIIKKLISDSNRLEALFSKNKPNEIDYNNCGLYGKNKQSSSGEELTLRYYWRQATFENELSTISKDFDTDLPKTRPNPKVHKRTGLLDQHLSLQFYNIRKIASLCRGWKSHLEPGMDLRVRNLLIESNRLCGIDSMDLNQFPITTMNFSQWIKLNSNFRNNWLNLYSLALTINSKELWAKWTLILTSLAFSGTSLEDLLILHTVAVHPDRFPCTPTYPEYINPSETFVKSVIRGYFSTQAKPYSHVYMYLKDGSIKYTTTEEREVARQLYLTQVQKEVERFSDEIEVQWRMKEPTERFTVSGGSDSKINFQNTLRIVKPKIAQLYKNLELTEFITKVGSSLRAFITVDTLVSNVWTEMPANENVKSDLFQIDFVKMMFSQNLDEFMEIHNSLVYTRGNIYSNVFSDDESKLAYITSTSKSILTTIQNRMQPPESVALVSSGLYPRLIPSTLLPRLLFSYEDLSDRWQSIKNSIGAVAVLWTLEQRLIRCLRYKMLGPLMEIALQRELETEGYENWSPKDHPGWLLLQLEMNMMIRPIQLKVAQEMMTPESCKNSVMQLNMGEGKTSLIVPMLAISLANGEQLCRVTVIKSIFETNFNTLRHTLGGMLNKRIYTVPCRRDLKMGIQDIENIQKTYEECLIKQGIIVTLPEYRLSFQLKGYEMARKVEMKPTTRYYPTNDEADAKITAMSLIRIQKWLNKKCRDILDESDDILSVKYQLVYTVGNQLPIDGVGIRWGVCQHLLKRIPRLMKDLSDKYGTLAVEFDKNKLENPAEFPPCRLLKRETYQELIDMIAEDFLDGRLISFPQVKQVERKLIKKFLVAEITSMTKAEHDEALQIFADDFKNKEIILILAGYLKFEVLRVALEKRWRVNYGVNVNGHRKMAVPFKAKDVATERTEFGHPDMAIILTQLSYYYSGLSDSQLEDCFDYLEHKHCNPDDEYASWIQSIPLKNVDPSVRNYKGINLADYEQRTQLLFPMLRKVMVVIDFWLSSLVFPKESKQFPAKMSCTAWDLCSENQGHLITGFSGTNDSSNLLPLNISQHDLPELQNTNRKLEGVLLKEENNQYLGLPLGISSKDILQKLKEKSIKVLLDCGALMLELSNKEVADAWLAIDPTIEAVIYFNSHNVETVKIRNSKDCPLELSPYRGGVNMGLCAVYLDDEHTRGTDLKIPTGSRACVTIGSGLTRDKMVQACMRMRLLGKGHTVTFWASQEVHNKIRNATNRNVISSKDVLQWVRYNSEMYQNEGLVYWTASAVNYCEKRTAEVIFGMSNDETNEMHDDISALNMLSAQCSQNEVTTLREMYGHLRSEELFVKIIPSWFLAAKNSFMSKLQQAHSPKTRLKASVKFETVENNVISRCEKLIPKKKHFSQLLDEEQEKELEAELETEKEVSRPSRATPLQHELAHIVKFAIGQGDILSHNREGAMMPLPHAFKTSGVWKLAQPNCWGDSIFVTRDFMNSVKSEGHFLDDFLHSPAWIVSMETNGKIYLLVISPYEANILIDDFRKGVFKSTLHIYTPKYLPGQRTLIQDPSFCLPISSNAVVKLTEELLAPLSLFAGTLYFAGLDEQQTFGDFLGIVPRPRHPDVEVAFENGLICNNGFVKPEHRRLFKSLIKDGAFGTNPEELVNKILLLRHEGYLPANSHVAKLTFDGLKTFSQ